MTDQETARDVIEKVKDELTPIWLGGRQRMMLEREIAHALAAEREACVKIVNGWREEDPPEDVPSELWKYIGHILDKKADAIRTRGR